MVAERPARVRSVPAHPPSALGSEAVELAASVGLVLDDWQASVLEESLGRREDGQWSAYEVGLLLPRQNGKTAILEARVLAGLFLIGEEELIYSAHEFATALEMMNRLEALIEDAPGLSSGVKRISRTNGREAIVLTSGQRVQFRTRTRGGGRGMSCDCLIYDEAMFLADFAIGATLPTLSARPNPQVWYAGSAVDQEIHENGLVLARLRERGMAGVKGLAYFDWSLDLADPSLVTEEIAHDTSAWAVANPALGGRITLENVEHELAGMDPRTFAVERLNVGDWPRTDHSIDTIIRVEDWDGLVDQASRIADPVCLAFDVSPDRRGSIAAAGRNMDGRWHVEVGENRQGVGWIAGRLAELWRQRDPLVVVCDGYGPAASIVTAVEEAGVPVVTVSAGEHAQACGLLVDAVSEKTLRHLGSDELRRAVKGAATRPLGDAWAWSRKGSNVDISPLVASTLALWAAVNRPDMGGDVAIF